MDFLISTDVFEHVAPPVVDALANARRMLKSDGVVVFSAPYMASGENIEHFPNLYEYRIEKRDGVHRLINRTRDGTLEVFEDLVFHGGEGFTLETRVFSEPVLLDQLRQAGFAPPRIYGDPVPKWGIYWQTNLSLPMALRPASRGSA